MGGEIPSRPVKCLCHSRGSIFFFLVKIIFFSSSLIRDYQIVFVTVNCQGRRQLLAALSKFEVDISLMAFHAFKRCFGFWILMSTIPLYKSSFFFLWR